MTPNRSLNRTLHSVPAFVQAKTLAQMPSRCSRPVSFDVRPHTSNMWRITTFAPAAVLLLLLAWITLSQSKKPSRKHTAYLTIAMALLSWLTVVLSMQLHTGHFDRYGFVAQRDIGYFFGSALFLCAPFAVVSILSLAIQRPNLGKGSAVGLAYILASAGSIFVPGLFAAGWVTGCVFSG